MLFVDRIDAAQRLAQKLQKYKGKGGVVLAVPRGGVPIGYYIAIQIGFELDLLMTKKLGHPSNEEFAIGAVGLEGSIIEEQNGISPEYIKTETAKIRQQLKERYQKFMGESKPMNIEGKVAIIVDDGIATGRTVLATLKILRDKNPEKLVVAVPVASEQAAERISKEVDEFISLYTPFHFYGVGRFYQDFSQTTDEEVIAFLNETREKA
ncbi:MAG: phosphoribosyltransferase [Ginsengibacter sp.]